MTKLFFRNIRNLILFIFLFSINNNIQSQVNGSGQLVTIQVQQVALSEIFASVSEQTGYRFSYNAQLVDTGELFSVNIQNKSLEKSLEIILPAHVQYKIVKKHIILLPAEEEFAEEASRDTILLEKILLAENKLIPIDNQPIVDLKHEETLKEFVNSAPKHPNNTAVNIQVFDLANFHTIEVSYTIDNIQIYESDTDDLILKEYLGQNTTEYMAWTRQTNGMLHIKNGKRFLWFGNTSRIEIYLPKTFNGTLKVNNISGQIQSEMDFSLAQLTLTNVSGGINIQSAVAESIELKTSAGKITADDLTGYITVSSIGGRISLGNLSGEVKEIVNMSNAIEINEIKASSAIIKNTAGKTNVNHAVGNLTITSFSGAVDINEIEGSANINTTTGMIKTAFTHVSDNVFLKSVSGRISLVVPENLSFNLIASSTRGTIQTYLNNENEGRHKSLNLRIGDAPKAQIEITTTTGNVEIKYP